jgi:hypothetical protein
MTRFIHDQFAKQYLTELFTPYGKVETSKDITSEVRQIDILFTPSSPSPENIETLGILGRMGTYANSVVIEPFRNAVSESEIRSCMGKLFDIHAEIERQGKRNNTKTNNQELPFLWILTPTASEELLSGCNATLDLENWGPGVYFTGKVFKTGIIVIHQLPSTPETLFLRLLGRGKVQRQAVEELEALANNNPFLENVIKLVNDLIAILSARQQKEKDIDQDDQELIMKLSEMYEQLLEELKEQKRQEGIEEGLKQGREQGLKQGREQGLEQGREQGLEQGLEQGEKRERRAMVESILQVRFGEIDSELEKIVDNVINISREEFTPVLLQLSREDLLARFRN